MDVRDGRDKVFEKQRGSIHIYKEERKRGRMTGGGKQKKSEIYIYSERK